MDVTSISRAEFDPSLMRVPSAYVRVDGPIDLPEWAPPQQARPQSGDRPDWNDRRRGRYAEPQ